MQKTCIIIAGPTAIGKTATAIEVAKYFNTQIVSADSRQCYKEMNIGTAKPSPAELSTVEHFFINSHSINDSISAADFESYAMEKVDQILHNNRVAVIVGGTGLYIKAFVEGLDQIPAIDNNIRQDILENYEQNGLEWLQDAIKKEDTLFFQKGEIYNPQRMMRALEVKRSTGKSIFEFHRKDSKKRPFKIVQFHLQIPKDILHERINTRVDKMMDEGLLDEVKKLHPHRHLNALQTVGYKELFNFIDGNTDLKTAVEEIKKNTRSYAKRQITWFKKVAAMHNCGSSEVDYIIRTSSQE